MDLFQSTKDAEIRRVEDLAKSETSRQSDRANQIRTQLEQRIAEQHSQIVYLQRRIKEIVEEAATGPELPSQKPEGAGLINHALKKELLALGNEVILIRELIRKEERKDTALINQKLSAFDEFKLKVLEELIVWDKKTAELARVADRYYQYLEEQRTMFLRVQQVVADKDKVIEQLRSRLTLSEQSFASSFNSVRFEL